MGLAETLLTRAAAPAETRAMQVTPWGPWNTGGGLAAGINVDSDSAMRLLTVYGCVSLIADTIATLPRKVYRQAADGTRTEIQQVPRWFEQPSATVDIIEFLTQSLTSLLLDGNCYWAYGVDGNFAPTELHVLNPTQVQVRGSLEQPGTIEYWVRGQRFNGRLLHIKGATRAGSLKGMSPVEAARQAIGIGLAAQEFAGAFYKNGTILSGVIKVPGSMNTDQARELKNNFSIDHAGASNAHQPGVLTNGAEWQQLSVTPEQAQFLESRNYQASEIAAQLFLLDPSLLGIAATGSRGQNLTYANLEQRGIHLVQFTLLRWIIRLERAFTSLLPRPQFMKFNVDAIQRADLKTRYEAYRIALGPTQPFLTVAEPRELEDLPVLPNTSTLEGPQPAAPPPSPEPAAPPEVNVHVSVPTPEVHVAPPEVRVEFTSPTPEVHVAAPEVHVAAPEVRVEVAAAEVNVPATVVNLPAPEVNVDVAAPEVHVAAPDVTVDVQPTEVTVHPPQVNVAAPEVNVHQPDIHVAPPAVNVAPPEVHVAAPDVYVDGPQVNVDSPVVHVRPPAVRIDAPRMVINQPRRVRRTFEYDENGTVSGYIEETLDDEPEEESTP